MSGVRGRPNDMIWLINTQADIAQGELGAAQDILAEGDGTAAVVDELATNAYGVSRDTLQNRQQRLRVSFRGLNACPGTKPNISAMSHTIPNLHGFRKRYKMSGHPRDPGHPRGNHRLRFSVSESPPLSSAAAGDSDVGFTQLLPRWRCGAFRAALLACVYCSP